MQLNPAESIARATSPHPYGLRPLPGAAAAETVTLLGGGSTAAAALGYQLRFANRVNAYRFNRRR